MGVGLAEGDMVGVARMSALFSGVALGVGLEYGVSMMSSIVAEGGGVCPAAQPAIPMVNTARNILNIRLMRIHRYIAGIITQPFRLTDI